MKANSFHLICSSPLVQQLYKIDEGLQRSSLQVVNRYNHNMGGVDKADQYSVYFSFGRRRVKWWRKVMFWQMEMALGSSFILYKATVDKPVSHANYRRKFITALCEGIPIGDV